MNSRPLTTSFGVQNQPFGLAQRRVPHRRRCVIGRNNFGAGPKNSGQLVGAAFELDLIPKMSFGIDFGNIFAKPSLCSFNGEVGNIEILHHRRPIADDQAHRFDHFAAAVAPLHLPRDQQTFIAIVVENSAVMLEIRLRQGLRNPLHDQIAHRVGMAQSFAFDDLHIGTCRWRLVNLLNMNWLHGHSRSRTHGTGLIVNQQKTRHPGRGLHCCTSLTIANR